MLVLCGQLARSGEGHGRSWVESGRRERDSGGEETVERRPDEGVSWLIAAGRKCAALYKRYSNRHSWFTDARPLFLLNVPIRLSC